MAKPTPTQEELDRIAMGDFVIDKEPDGSPEDEAAAPPTSVAKPPGEGEEAEPKRKQSEAKPAAPAGGYQTRQATPAQTRPTTPRAASSDTPSD